jgi:hypothetical protein
MNNLDHVQMAQMCWLIWIYTVNSIKVFLWSKGINLVLIFLLDIPRLNSGKEL